MTWRTINLTHIILIVVWLIVLPLLLRATAADIRPGQVKVVTFGPDEGQVSISYRLDFTHSRFPMPTEEVLRACDRACAAVKRAQRIEQAAAYIHQHNRKIDAVATATAFVDGSADYPPDYLWLALAVARFESSFRVHVGSAHYGLFQIDAPRRKAIRSSGGDPTDAEDQVRYFVEYVADHRAEGDSWLDALHPWSVKHRALREWKRIK